MKQILMPKDAHEMNESEVRSRIITLGFGGDERLFIAFYRKLQQGLPEGTGIVLRGSVVTNQRHEDGQPFDSLGKGTSDLDVTLVGSKGHFVENTPQGDVKRWHSRTKLNRYSANYSTRLPVSDENRPYTLAYQIGRLRAI